MPPGFFVAPDNAGAAHAVPRELPVNSSLIQHTSANAVARNLIFAAAPKFLGYIQSVRPFGVFRR